MTEQERYDQLDRALDALISEGQPALTGDTDLDVLVRLASGLRGLPDPDFKVRLRAELLPPPARRRLLHSLRRNVMSTPIPYAITRPRLAGALAFATAAAVAAVIGLLLVGPFAQRGAEQPIVQPQPTEVPEEAFGTLPFPSPGGAKGGGGVLIPSNSGAITYTLSPDISLPRSALAFRLAPVTPQRVQEIARNLGFSENVEPVMADEAGTAFGYRVASAPACPPDLPPPPPDTPKEEYEAKHCTEPARLFQMTLDGSISFRSALVPPSGAAPSEEQARAAAEAWLRLTGLTGSDPFTLTVGEVIPGAGLRQVVVERADLSDLAFLIFDRPQIVVSVAGDGSVFDASGFWAGIETESTYPLHGVEALLANLKNLRGEFDYLFSAPVGGKDQPPPPPVPPDTFQDASASVKSVEVAYSRGVAAGGRVYLVPVYILRVHLTQPGLPEPFPFATWVPASGPLASPPEVPAALAELIAVRDSLPLPPGATFRGSFPLTGFAEPVVSGFVELVGLQTRYFVEQTPEAAAAFYRLELPAQGWQQEEPARTRQPLEEVAFPGYTSFISFVRHDLRVVALVGPNEKDPSLGATSLELSVERRGPFAQVTDELNVRSQATTEAEIVGRLEKGEAVELLEQVEGEEAEPGSGNQVWYRIAQGYIYSAYVSKP